MTRATRWLLVVAWTTSGLGCAGIPRSPTSAFDQYVEAYLEGEAERVWELSSPTARADGRRVRDEMMVVLTDPDAAKRVRVEGMFGITADDVRDLTDKQFFVWAVHAIRKRLGGAWIRRALGSWERMHVRSLGPNAAVVVYATGKGGIGQMRTVRVGDVWYVDESPFPPAEGQGAPDPGGQGEPNDVDVPGED